MATYDRIDWHSGGNFPENLPAENGGTHIGMFLTWIIENDLYGNLHREGSKDSIQKVLKREWTGRDFLINECDEKFWEDCMNEEGNQFTKFYYDTEREGGTSYFLADYSWLFGATVESLYEIENSWDNYDKLKPLIDQRYGDWSAKK